MDFFKKKIDYGDPNQAKAYRKTHKICEVCAKHPTNDTHHIVNAIANKKIECFGNYLAVCRRCHTKLEKMPRIERIKTGLEIKFSISTPELSPLA